MASAESLKTLVLATGDIVLPTFDWLLAQAELEIGLLVSQPDRPVGRKKILTSPRVVERAREAGIEVFQPENLRRRTARQELQCYGPSFDLGVVMAYGQILTAQVIDTPRLGCWNLHASLLPRHRGAAPIQAAIAAGDEQSGITVMQVEPSLDAGPILHTEVIPLRPDHTGGLLHDELAELAPTALAAAFERLRAGTLEPVAQEHEAATHVGKLTREDGVLDPRTRGAREIERLIRAYDPWPGTTLLQELRPGAGPVPIKLFPPATLLPTPAGLQADGRLHASPDRKALRLPCADGLSLELREVQVPGKPRMAAADFLRGQSGF